MEKRCKRGAKRCKRGAKEVQKRCKRGATEKWRNVKRRISDEPHDHNLSRMTCTPSPLQS